MIRLSINEHRWTLRFPRSITRDGERCDGLCDPNKRVLLVDRKLSGQEAAETIIHEVIHASGLHLDEEFVTRTARDIAAALYHSKVQERL